MKEKRKFRISFFLVGDSQKSKRVFWKVYAWLGVLVKVGTLFFHQVGQIWSFRADFFCPESSPRDLAFGHGFRACYFRNGGEPFVLLFESITFGPPAGKKEIEV